MMHILRCMEHCEPIVREIVAELLPDAPSDLAEQLAWAECLLMSPLRPSPKDRAAIERLVRALDEVDAAWQSLPPSAKGTIAAGARLPYWTTSQDDLTKMLDDMRHGRPVAGPDAVTAIHLRPIRNAAAGVIDNWPRRPRGREGTVQGKRSLQLWAVLDQHGVSKRLASRCIAALFVRCGTVGADEDPEKLADTIYQRIRNAPGK